MTTMPTLASLNDELEQLTAQRATLRAQYPGAVMPADATTRDSELMERMSAVHELIQEEQQRARDAMFAETARTLADPRRVVPASINSDDTGRERLMKSGWSIRGGYVYRQTATGDMAYLPESVLFGALPTDDPVAAQHFRTMRAHFQPEYRNVWLKWLSSGGSMARLTSQEQNALSEGTDTAGGFLVPADIQAEILARRADASVMRQICTVRQTSRDRIQFPAVAPHGSSGSIYSSGFVGGLVGEVTTSTDQGPTFQQFEVSIKKFQAYTKVSKDLIKDSGADVLAFLATDGGRNLGLVEDNYFLNGLGTGLEPMGLLTASPTTFDVEGSTANTISNTIAAAGSAPKIIAGSYQLPGQYSDGATWLMNRSIMGNIHGLVDAQSRPWWQAANIAGGSEGAPPLLVNIPARTSPFMPSNGTPADGTKVLLLGDFSNYIIAERQALSVEIDESLYRASDEAGIWLRSRAGGGVWNLDAFRVGIV